MEQKCKFPQDNVFILLSGSLYNAPLLVYFPMKYLEWHILIMCQFYEKIFCYDIY